MKIKPKLLMRLKFILFFAFVFGGIFFAKSLFFPSYYEAEFTVALIPKQVDYYYIDKQEQSLLYALNLVQEATRNDLFFNGVFWEEVNQILNQRQNNLIYFAKDKTELRKTITVIPNNEAKTLKFIIKDADPDQALVLAQASLAVLEKELNVFTHNPTIDLMVLSPARESAPVGITTNLWFLVKGALLGILTALILLILLPSQVMNWFSRRKESSIDQAQINAIKQMKSDLMEKFTPEPEIKPKPKPKPKTEKLAPKPRLSKLRFQLSRREPQLEVKPETKPKTEPRKLEPPALKKETLEKAPKISKPKISKSEANIPFKENLKKDPEIPSLQEELSEEEIKERLNRLISGEL